MQHLSTQCPGSISIRPISAMPWLHSWLALGHLVLKTQPEGLSKGLGIFPGIGLKGSSKLFTSGSAWSNPFV